jgi:glycosyltransferase involved in cell wall biosynthesis
MRITVSTWGRFHLFHLARRLQRIDALERIFSTYPKFKLRDEGIQPHRLFTSAAIETLLRAKERLGIRLPALDAILEVAKVDQFDRFVRRHWVQPDIYIALSGSGGANGPRAQADGARYICDRGSTHIVHAEEVMREEFARYGLAFRGAHPSFVDRELQEYAAADLITVPSTYAAETYLQRGLPRAKLFVNPYGASLDRFSRVADPDPAHFTVLFVGAARLRKGFGHLLEAFRRFDHPRKRLWVVGDVLPETRTLIEAHGGDDIAFLGIVPNADLSPYYSSADVMVLPSIEEGLALVQAEALACGCPVIATPNSGSADLFENGVQGFIVPARDPATITERLAQIAQTPGLWEEMGAAGLQRIRQIGGWDSYGDRYIARCRELLQPIAAAA